MNPWDEVLAQKHFGHGVRNPQDLLDRLREKQLQEERREARQRNEALKRARRIQQGNPAVKPSGAPHNHSGPIVGPKYQPNVAPIGSGSTISNPSPSSADPFGLDTLRTHLAETKKEVKELRAAADAVLAIHSKVKDKREGRDFYCGHCSTAYPCITVLALLGDSE